MINMDFNVLQNQPPFLRLEFLDHNSQLTFFQASYHKPLSINSTYKYLSDPNPQTSTPKDVNQQPCIYPQPSSPAESLISLQSALNFLSNSHCHAEAPPFKASTLLPAPSNLNLQTVLELVSLVLAPGLTFVATSVNSQPSTLTMLIG